MIKVPFEQVYIEVDKMYNDNMHLTSEHDINNLCEDITSFIVNCGWDINEFNIKMICGCDNAN